MDFKFSDLSAPFAYEDIEWRAGATNKEKTKALALAYITSRAVMNRLDEVCGPHNWKDIYAPGPDGGVICGLSIRVGDEWITKWDGAENSNIEAVKGGLSDAFKRAAVKWGIGRYLYGLESVWVTCEQRGNTTVLTGKPTLPAWALPAQKPNGKPAAPQPLAERAKPEPPQPDEPDFEPGGMVETAANLGAEVKMTLETAKAVKNSKGVPYGELDSDTLSHMSASIIKAKSAVEVTPEQAEAFQYKLDAIRTILAARN